MGEREKRKKRNPAALKIANNTAYKHESVEEMHEARRIWTYVWCYLGEMENYLGYGSKIWKNDRKSAVIPKRSLKLQWALAEISIPRARAAESMLIPKYKRDEIDRKGDVLALYEYSRRQLSTTGFKLSRANSKNYWLRTRRTKELAESTA